MRHLGNLPDLDQSQRLSDYLEALQIPVRLVKHGELWSIWVREEDQAVEARECFEKFLRQPGAKEIEDLATRTRVARGIKTLATLEKARDGSQSRRLPSIRDIARQAPLTTVLIGLSLFVTMATDFGTNFNSASMQSLTFNNPSHIYEEGSEVSSSGSRDIRRGELWRLATPIFLHFGWLHVAFNAILLFQLGYVYETRCGSWLLGLIILVTGVVGNVGQYICDGSTLFGGFSGVIFGLVAFAWVRSRWAPAEGLRISNEPVLLLLVFLVVGFTGSLDDLVNTEALSTHIANWSHLFGLAAGGILAVVLPLSREDDDNGAIEA